MVAPGASPGRAILGGMRRGPAFPDRAAAGRSLAARLAGEAGPDTVVLGLARGGVAVAAPVAEALAAPLDAMVVRKIGAPGQPELALGAIAPGDTRILNEALVRVVEATPGELAAAEAKALEELERRQRRLRGDAPPLALDGRRVLLVDDGLATGATMLAAVRSARALGARELVVAVPVASREALARIGGEADRIVALSTPVPFGAVGRHYDRFNQVTDDEVRALLGRPGAGGDRREGPP